MIPLVRPEIPTWSRVDRYFSESRNQGKISNFGPCYWRLVERLSELTNRFCVPCSSGTSAIQLAAQVEFDRGDRILCPDYTHIGTLQALVASGMRPILAPVDRQTWTLSPHILTSFDKYDGFVVVSPFGYGVDFHLYDQLARDLKKSVVYDLAGAFGMKVTTTAPVCYSMHATKNVPIGEGGIASFASIKEAHLAHQFSCFDQNQDRSIDSPYGGNFKLDEVRCAIALAQLEEPRKIEARAERKRFIVELYHKLLGSSLVPHKLHLGNAMPSLCVVSGLPASKIEPLAKQAGFEAKQYYPQLSDMEGLQKIECAGKSSTFFRTCTALPSDVSDQEAKWIAKSILSMVRENRAKVPHTD